MDYEIIATRGNTQFLLVQEDKSGVNDNGRILDIEQKIFFDWQPIQSILKWGYWEPYEGFQEKIKELLRGVEVREENALQD
jgi:hypothetical protein